MAFFFHNPPPFLILVGLILVLGGLAFVVGGIYVLLQKRSRNVLFMAAFWQCLFGTIVGAFVFIGSGTVDPENLLHSLSAPFGFLAALPITFYTMGASVTSGVFGVVFNYFGNLTFAYLVDRLQARIVSK